MPSRSKPYQLRVAILVVLSLLLVASCSDTTDEPVVAPADETVDFVLEFVFDEHLDSSLKESLRLRIRTTTDEPIEVTTTGAAEVDPEDPGSVDVDGPKSGNIRLTGSARVPANEPLKFSVKVGAKLQEGPQGYIPDETREDLRDSFAVANRAWSSMIDLRGESLKLLQAVERTPNEEQLAFLHELAGLHTQLGELQDELEFVDRRLIEALKAWSRGDKAWAKAEWDSLQAAGTDLISQPYEAIFDGIDAAIARARDEFGVEIRPLILRQLEVSRADTAELIRQLS